MHQSESTLNVYIIGLLKNRYRILNGLLSTTCITEKNEGNITGIDKLVTVCSALYNLGDRIVSFPFAMSGKLKTLYSEAPETIYGRGGGGGAGGQHLEKGHLILL